MYLSYANQKTAMRKLQRIRSKRRKEEERKTMRKNLLIFIVWSLYVLMMFIHFVLTTPMLR
jgi:hypothetical protein